MPITMQHQVPVIQTVQKHATDVKGSDSPEDSDDPTGAVQCQRSWIPLCPRLRRSRLLRWRRILPSLKQMSSEVAELYMDLGAQCAQQQKMDAMRPDGQKIFATTNEDLRHVTADVPVVMRRQVLVIQRVQRTVDVPLV